MDTATFRAHREYFEMVHGVTMRAIGVLEDADLEFRPKEGMRTAKEILFHIYAVEKGLAEGVGRGELGMDDLTASEPEQPAGVAAVANIRTVEGMKQFAQRCHDEANRALANVTGAELGRVVRSPLWVRSPATGSSGSSTTSTGTIAASSTSISGSWAKSRPTFTAIRIESAESCRGKAPFPRS